MGRSQALTETKEERNRRYGRESAKRLYKGRRVAAVRAAAEAKNKPCADCGLTFPPCAMDALFEDKRIFRVQSQPPATIRRILSEAEIVCANCGRKRAYQTVWRAYSRGIK